MLVRLENMPPLVSFWPAVRPLFLIPCPSQVRPFWARCVVLVFSLLFSFLLLRSRLVSRLGKVSSHVHGHFIFMSISPTLLRQGVCVCVTSKQM